MSILEPGLRSWLGPVVKELILNITRQVNRDMINNNIDKMEYVKKLAEIMNWSKKEARYRDLFKA